MSDTSDKRTPVFSLTLLACDVAREAAASTAEVLRSASSKSQQIVKEAEVSLDHMDREIDDRVTEALTAGASKNARELLACMKAMVDIERIGDLLVSVCNTATTIQGHIAAEDAENLTRMASVLEQMLVSSKAALENSDLQPVTGLLRADEELDRLRNLTLMRHLDGAIESPRRDSIHVVFIAQALERAGDHAKNMGETVAHLVGGKSVRHLGSGNQRSIEQMYLDHLRTRGTPPQK